MSKRASIAYQPALDGVRAISVLAVLLFHGGVSWLAGGYLGVSVFFTLSGYLITSLLLAEVSSAGKIDAAAFYTRRARRLLPASLVCLAAIAVAAATGSFDGVPHLRRDITGALLQVFNWVKLFSGESYADISTAQAGLRNPLDHYWSLAIEEQFYWIWPVVFAWLVRRRSRAGATTVRPIVTVTIGFGVAAPVIALVWGTDAAYWATPARVCEILVGAAVAVWIAAKGLPRWASFAAAPALVALAVASTTFPSGRGPAYHGALPLVALASGALIIGVQVDGPVRRLLGVAPLAALGRISYGVYLYHWPVFVIVDRQGWDLGLWPMLAVKVAITLVISLASYFLIERPIRSASWLPPRRTLISALGATAAVAALLTIVPTVTKYYLVDADEAAAAAIDTGPVEDLAPAPAAPTSTTSSVAPSGSSEPNVGPTTTAGPTTTSTLVPSRPVRILVVGDSTAEATGAGLIAWAAKNPALAQVSLEVNPGCPLAPGGWVNQGEDVSLERCTPWIREEVPAAVASLQPDVVMLMTTTWDVEDRRLVADGPLLNPTIPEMADLLRQEFTGLTDLLLANGASRVVWIREPIANGWWFNREDGEREPERHEVLYGIMADLAAARPEVRVADLVGWMAERQLIDDKLVRPDGVHFAPEWSERIATEFLGPLLVQAALT